jgi:hypothetical protein
MEKLKILRAQLIKTHILCVFFYCNSLLNKLKLIIGGLSYEKNI